MSSSTTTGFSVNGEILQFYRQEVLNTITKWQRGENNSSSSAANLPMALASFVRNNNRTTTIIPSPSSNNNTNNNMMNNFSPSSHQNHHPNIITKRLCRCVVCGKEEQTASQLQETQANYEDTIKNDPSSASYFRLRALGDEIANKYITYDGLDHCLSCARRLACEILLPHFATTRREDSKRILNKILETEKNSSSNNNHNIHSNTLRKDAAAATTNNSSSSSSCWTCNACGTKNEENSANSCCEVCQTPRPQPLICPYCNQDAVEVEFCPKDPQTSFESYLTYDKNDPVLNMSWRSNNKNSSSSSPLLEISGRHDAWRCEHAECNHTLNLGLLHKDFCRKCKKPRVWHCLGCKSSYRERTFCPHCGSRKRAGGRSELEEIDLCKLTGLTLEEARRQRRVNMVLEQAKRRSTARVEKQMGLTLVKAADDGNCLFRALSFQLFRTASLHYLLRLLAVEHIIEEKDTFINFVFGLDDLKGGNEDASNNGDDQELRFYNYVKRLCKEGEWGDSLTLHAISKIFNCQIHIVSAAMEQWHNVISPSPAVAAAAASNLSEDDGNNRNLIISPIQPKRNENNNNNDQQDLTFFDKVGLIFISFVAELHYNSFVYSPRDSREDVLPYRQWLVSGEFFVAPNNNHQHNNNCTTTTTSSGKRIIYLDEDEDGHLQQHDSNRNKNKVHNVDEDEDDDDRNNNHTNDDDDDEVQVVEHRSSSSSQQQHSNWRVSATTTKPSNNYQTSSSAIGSTFSNNNNNNRQPILVQIRTLQITPTAPFDRVAIYIPNSVGHPAWWVNFHPQSHRLRIDRVNLTEPQFYQRHIVPEVPDYIKNAFPLKMRETSGLRNSTTGERNQFFTLLDEVGKNVVTTMLPFSSQRDPKDGKYYISENFATYATKNEVFMASRENILCYAEKSPRPTVMGSFADGTCCLGPWLFVLEFFGSKATIGLEKPGANGTIAPSNTYYQHKAPVQMVFVDEHLVRQCAACRQWYVTGHHKECPALQQQQQSHQIQQGRSSYF